MSQQIGIIWIEMKHITAFLRQILDDELIDVENVIVSEEIADVTFKDEIIKVLYCAAM